MLIKDILMKRIRNTVTVWKNPVNDGYNNISYDAPETLQGLYFYKHEKHQSEDGDIIATSLVLYCERLLSINDVVFLGESVNPTPDAGSYQVTKITIYTTLYDNVTIYRYYLKDSNKGYKAI